MTMDIGSNPTASHSVFIDIPMEESARHPVFSTISQSRDNGGGDGRYTERQNMIHNFQSHFLHKKDLYLESSKHYRKLFLIFVVPAAIIGLSSSVAAFVNATPVVSEEHKYILSIAIGVMNIVSTFIHTSAEQLELSTKHNSFSKVVGDIEEVLLKLRYQKYDDMDKDELLLKVRDKERKINASCGFIPPVRIVSRSSSSSGQPHENEPP